MAREAPRRHRGRGRHAGGSTPGLGSARRNACGRGCQRGPGRGSRVPFPTSPRWPTRHKFPCPQYMHIHVFAVANNTLTERQFETKQLQHYRADGGNNSGSASPLRHGGHRPGSRRCSRSSGTSEAPHRCRASALQCWTATRASEHDADLEPLLADLGSRLAAAPQRLALVARSANGPVPHQDRRNR